MVNKCCVSSFWRMGDGIPIDIENGIPIPIIRLMLIHFSFS